MKIKKRYYGETLVLSRDPWEKGINWTYENQFLRLHPWEKGITAEHPCFQEIQIWIQAWNIPIHWVSTEVGVKFGRIFKRTIDVSVPQVGPLAGKCLRLKAVIDVNQPLLRCTYLKMGETRIQIQFKYERLVNCCFYCGYLGHLDKSCEKRATDIANGCLAKGLYGEWLKAQDIVYYSTQSATFNNINSRDSSQSPNASS
ncbi:Unknown protein [Striga hermonthica]|uniref:CCHC-type domain-containing protein n=1 Tax=Striga hermonthica TaxID=68872 RepID=A0A9N7N331_STRHE|nr:Unknown protein [Striga hermonthica]